MSNVLTDLTTTEQLIAVVDALSTLVTQVDEDCPQEYRTSHLKNAISDATELVNAFHESNSDDAVVELGAPCCDLCGYTPTGDEYDEDTDNDACPSCKEGVIA